MVERVEYGFVPHSTLFFCMEDFLHQHIKVHIKHISENNNRENSKVRDFFKNSGFEVIDNRYNAGRLWIIGEKTDIRNTVNSAITQFGISGKYSSSKETNFKNGWYTKTDK